MTGRRIAHRTAQRLNGWTFVEVCVSVALLGIISMGIFRVNQNLLVSATNQNNTQMMSDDVNVLMTAVLVELKKAGAGVQGQMTSINGKTVIAMPDNPLANTFNDLIFVSKDNGTIGTLDPADVWTRISTETVEGKPAMLIRTYTSDNWLTIKSGATSADTTRVFKMQSGASLESLAFTLYDSNTPPIIANQAPYAASAVRVSFNMKKVHTTYQKENIVTLDNILYGPH